MSDALVKVDEDVEDEAPDKSLAKILEEVVGEDHEQALVAPRPIDKGVDTSIFGRNSFGNGIKWAAAKPELQIEMKINFTGTGTFTETIYGKVIK